MNQIIKAIKILALLFFMRVFQGCPNCNNEPYLFDFDNITISNLDNSKDYIRWLDSDSMYSSAIAFEITISGREEFSFFLLRDFGFGFTELSAMEDCPMKYKSNQQVSGIKIISLEAISPDIPANTDVTELFTVSSEFRYLYIPFNELYKELNTEYYYDEPSVSFQAFLTENVTYKNAQFSFIITFTDGKVLEASSNLIEVVSKVE